MIYFYSNIPRHPIGNLHRYLHYFFEQLFAEVNPTYSHAHHIHQDFQGIIDEYKTQIDDKLAAIFRAYMRNLNSAEKQMVQNAYCSNNDIEGICNATITPIKYNELPSGIRLQVKNLYDELWGDSKILGYDKVVSKCGTVKEHFNDFREINEFSVCPFCGLERLLCEHDDGKDDYDHYLSKGKYPFITVNFFNLFPMCHKCNSKNKGQKDTPFMPNTSTQRRIYFPFDTSTVGHEIKLRIQADTTDLSNKDAWTLNIDCEPLANNDRKESWKEIFNIESRYKGIITKENYKWKERIRRKYTIRCVNQGVSFDSFRVDILNDNEDYFNIIEGILMKCFDEFIVNDPYCESNLSGYFTI